MRLPVQSNHVARSARGMLAHTGITAAVVCFDGPPGSCCAQTFCPPGFSCREARISAPGDDVVYKFSYCVANRFTFSFAGLN